MSSGRGHHHEMLTRTAEPGGDIRTARAASGRLWIGLLAGLALASVLSHLCFGTGGANHEYLATRGYGQFLPDTPWHVHGGPQLQPRLLILGSSKARNAFFADLVTDEGGLPALNLAMSGVPLSGVALQVEMVLSDHDATRPRLAVVAVSRSDLLAGGYGLRPLSACSDAVRALEGTMVWARFCGERIMWQGSRALLGLDPQRLRRLLLGLDTAPLLPERMTRCTRRLVEGNRDDLVLCQRGGILRTRAPVPSPRRRSHASKLSGVDERAFQLLAFVRARLRASGVAMRIALLPEWTKEKGDRVALEALRRGGFEVYDLTGSAGEDFYDPVHVNQAGGLTLTTRLVSALRSDLRAPD